MIQTNPYFDTYFGIVYAVILSLYLAAAILISMFLCGGAGEDPKSRSYVPWAFLLAAISSLGIAIWIVTYISCLYDEPYVKIPKR